MRLRVEAGRARTRTSVKVIVGATGRPRVGPGLSTAATSPPTTPRGPAGAAACRRVFTMAFVWLARMTRPADVERFLDKAPRLANLPTLSRRRGRDRRTRLWGWVRRGLFLIVRGLYPPRPSLAQALAQLRRVPEPTRVLSAGR